MIDRAPDAATAPAAGEPCCTRCRGPLLGGRRTLCHRCTMAKTMAARARGVEARARAQAKGLQWCPRCKKEHHGPYQRCEACRDGRTFQDLPAHEIERVFLEGDRHAWNFASDWRPRR